MFSSQCPRACHVIISFSFSSSTKLHKVPNNPPIPSHYLKEMLKLILQENSFQFIGNNYLQTHGTAMGTKMAVAFANIFMADIETKVISQSKTKPIEWKRFIDDIFPLWDSDKKEINLFIEQANTLPSYN